MNRTALAATALVVRIADLENKWLQMMRNNDWSEPENMIPAWDEMTADELQLMSMYFMAKANQKRAQSLLAVA